jgi:hypothetical protein
MTMGTRKVQITSQAISEAWQVFCAVHGSRGIDLRNLLSEAATSKAEWLSSWRYKTDFEELRKAGCSEAALAIALWIIHSAPTWGNNWGVVLGPKKLRDHWVQCKPFSGILLRRSPAKFICIRSHRTLGQPSKK